MTRAKAKTKTVFHPTLAGVTREVDESTAGSWKDAGWRFTEPGKATETVTPKAADSK